MFAKKRELRRVPEETGLGDGDQVQQVPQLGFHDARGLASQPVVVLVFPLQSELLHPHRDRRRQRRTLTVIEAKAASLFDQIADGGERS